MEEECFNKKFIKSSLKVTMKIDCIYESTADNRLIRQPKNVPEKNKMF